MTTVAWIRDVNQYRQIALKYPDVVTNSTLVTFDLAACWLWREQNVLHNSLWEFATLDDQIEIAQEALELSNTWLHGEQAMCYQGNQLDELCQTTLLYTFRDALLARRMAFNLLDRLSPTRFILPSSGAPDDESKVVEAVLRWAAARRDIPIETLGISETPKTPSPLRRVGWLYRNLQAYVSNTFLSLQGAFSRSTQPTVMFFGGGADFVNQLHIIEQLGSTRPYRVLHVNLHLRPPPSSAHSRSQTSKQHPSLYLLSYQSLAQYMEARRWCQRTWQWFENWRPAYKDRYPELFHNPWLESEFRTFFLTVLPQVSSAIKAAGQLLDAYTPKLVVLNNDAGWRERAVIHAAHKRNIPSAFLIHSGFNDLHFRHFYTDWIWVWGDMHYQQLTALGVPTDRIAITGNPNYDYVAEFKNAAPLIRARVRQQLGIENNETLLLLISAKSPHLLTFVDIAQHVQDLKTLCEALNTQPGVRLVIKPHPRYDDAAIYHLMAKQYKQIKVATDLLIDQLLVACDAALMVNTVTTGGLEALLLGKPLIWINSSVKYPPFFSIFDQGALVISQRSQIAPTLKRFLGSTEYQAAISDIGRKHLATLVRQSNGGATEAVISEIDRIIKAA